MTQRQIVLDTETTGLEVEQGHRIIEVGCVELRKRRFTRNDFHQYVHPEDRQIDPGAVEVHGITMDFLADKPRFRDLAKTLWDYLEGAELIIHNAAFDVGFLNMEFARAGIGRKLDEVCTITDTVAMARKLHPGQRVSLDALCRRYEIDNSNRELHGALLDAGLLAEVYLAMTGGQSRLSLDEQSGERASRRRFAELLNAGNAPLPVIRASESELDLHRARLGKIASKGKCLWQEDLPTA
ncbi:DNA polymerase III subunit epsilon [Sinimarinibacterium sp. CAU 1509]|uniref:DNA polymerase III subunit epsilon n=1 Tax=Sinimarinibacterium sp. CAU 1509 TaxID=2562283 RepID=UPI0010AC0E6B|nr:DNA polymerase III subunit epsilon [Sinimarinibacterium sp. CAU 1509]TJY61903.1 DNA polymerase III subunit epsilon [Sinimarinibacterium sp. CAU 1509]